MWYSQNDSSYWIQSITCPQNKSKTLKYLASQSMSYFWNHCLQIASMWLRWPNIIRIRTLKIEHSVNYEMIFKKIFCEVQRFIYRTVYDIKMLRLITIISDSFPNTIATIWTRETKRNPKKVTSKRHLKSSLKSFSYICSHFLVLWSTTNIKMKT